MSLVVRVMSMVVMMAVMHVLIFLSSVHPDVYTCTLYSALDGRLSRYQAEHKEIFYKITDPAALEQTAAAFS